MSCEGACNFEKLAEMGTKVMEETAKAMGLSEGATTKMREYFKKAHDLMKEKGDFHTKTDEEKKKWVEDSIVAIQAEVDEADKELVAKVVHAAHEEMQKKKAEMAAAAAQ